MRLNPETEVPLPDDLESAQKEILELRRKLIRTNGDLGDIWEEKVLLQKQLNERIKGSKSTNKVINQIIDHFRKTKCPWWPVEGKLGIVQELEKLKGKEND